MLNRYYRAGLFVLAVAAVALLLSTCGSEPTAGASCDRSELGRTTTLDGGDVLECRPVTAEQQVWELVGHNAESGSLVWVGWFIAVIGVSVLAAGLVGIVVARTGRRRPVRRWD